jgi:hypothetical protein
MNFLGFFEDGASFAIVGIETLLFLLPKFD